MEAAFDIVAWVAGEGRVNEAERVALARELDKLIGGVNPDGTPYVDPEGPWTPTCGARTAVPHPRARRSRPSS